MHDVGNPSRWAAGRAGMRERKQRKSMRSSIGVKLKINQSWSDLSGLLNKALCPIMNQLHSFAYMYTLIE